MFPKMVRNWYTQWLISGPGIQSSLKPSLFHLTHCPYSQTYTQASPQSRKWRMSNDKQWHWVAGAGSIPALQVGARRIWHREMTSPVTLLILWYWECQSSWEVKMMEDTWLKRRLEPNSSKELDLWFPFCPSGHPVPPSTHVPISSPCDLIFQPSPVTGEKL